MGFDAQPLPPATENRKYPHRTGHETAFERLRRKVQSPTSAGGTSVSKSVQIHSLPGRADLLELVRYIHLNPMRARQVATLRQLDRYRYSGHSALMGHCVNEWQPIDSVLRLFGKSISTARRQYRHFVEQGIALGRRPELIGGGLIRSLGG
jgi:hypothetical protein